MSIITQLQIEILHITLVVNPTFILINLIGLEVVLSILHMSDSFFDIRNFFVVIGELIIDRVFKDLLVQIEIIHGLSNVSKVVLYRTNLRWCHL
jgi:hypothetical protein